MTRRRIDYGQGFPPENEDDLPTPENEAGDADAERASDEFDAVAERANQAGMMGGVAAYNDAIGSSLDSGPPCGCGDQGHAPDCSIWDVGRCDGCGKQRCVCCKCCDQDPCVYADDLNP